MLELNASICGGEPPIHLDGFSVASLLPGFDLSLQFGLIPDTLAQRMLAQDTEFDLGHI